MCAYLATIILFIMAKWFHRASGVLVINSLEPSNVTCAVIILVNMIDWKYMYIMFVHKSSAS